MSCHAASGKLLRIVNYATFDHLAPAIHQYRALESQASLNWQTTSLTRVITATLPRLLNATLDSLEA